MKALILEEYGTPEQLELREVAKPEVKAGNVLVRVRATSVNDWDFSLVTGKPAYIRLFAGLSKPRVRIPGVDVSGVVEEVGEGSTRFSIGEAVYGDLSNCGFGAFAEYVSVPEVELRPKPECLSFEEAAAVPHAAALALQGLRDVGNLATGERLLINGAGGGVGTLGIQIAREMGVGEVTGVDSECKLEMMKQMGFDRVINYRMVDFTREGERYDLILDAKTNRSPFSCLRALNPKGRYVALGGSAGKLLQMAAMGAVVNRIGDRKLKILALKPNLGLESASELFDAGKVKTVVQGPYAFEELPRALREFGEAAHLGKIVVRI
ncbi:MAG: NAD(P)-dependent alcohol dehydrogenase [Verrucomicrobiota bacterium]